MSAHDDKSSRASGRVDTPRGPHTFNCLGVAQFVRSLTAVYQGRVPTDANLSEGLDVIELLEWVRDNPYIWDTFNTSKNYLRSVVLETAVDSYFEADKAAEFYNQTMPHRQWVRKPYWST